MAESLNQDVHQSKSMAIILICLFWFGLFLLGIWLQNDTEKFYLEESTYGMCDIL